MYNSRPRYTRYDSYPQTIKVPRNYSGNAFSDDFVRENTDGREGDEIIARADAAESAPEKKEKKEEKREERREDIPTFQGEVSEESGKGALEECSASPKKRSLFGSGFSFDLGKLFGGIGFEELLIVGIILLLAQNEGNEDIILLLILLFFIN